MNYEKQLKEIIKEFLSNDKTFLVLKEYGSVICSPLSSNDITKCCPEEIIIESDEHTMFMSQHQIDNLKNQVYAPCYDESIEYLKKFSDAKIIGILNFYEKGKKSGNYADFMQQIMLILRERKKTRKKTIITTWHSLESIGNISKQAEYFLSSKFADWYQVGRIKIDPEIFKI